MKQVEDNPVSAVLEPVTEDLGPVAADFSEPDVGELVTISVELDPVDTYPEPTTVEPDSVAAVSAATYAMPAEIDDENDYIEIDIN